MKTYPNNLYYLRKKANLTLEQVAEKLNTTAITISRYERGERELKGELLVEFSNLYNTNPNFILKYENQNDSSIPSDFEYALFGEVKDLSKEQKEDLMQFVQFLKTKENKK